MCDLISTPDGEIKALVVDNYISYHLPDGWTKVGSCDVVTEQYYPSLHFEDHPDLKPCWTQKDPDPGVFWYPNSVFF